MIDFKMGSRNVGRALTAYAAADVEESFHFYDTMKKPRLLVRDGVLISYLFVLRKGSFSCFEG